MLLRRFGVTRYYCPGWFDTRSERAGRDSHGVSTEIAGFSPSGGDPPG
jgi:hypothetical protein